METINIQKGQEFLYRDTLEGQYPIATVGFTTKYNGDDLATQNILLAVNGRVAFTQTIIPANLYDNPLTSTDNVLEIIYLINSDSPLSSVISKILRIVFIE